VVGVAENGTLDTTCAVSQALQFEPVIWEDGMIKELPTVSDDPDGHAVAINDRGQAVGSSGNCTNPTLHAVLWKHGHAKDLSNLGGTTNNIALAINDRGQVVGKSDLPGDTTGHAFLWHGGVMSDLGTLTGDFGSSADGINSEGQVVGGSFDINGNGRAFLWENGKMFDLNTLIPAGFPLVLTEATGGINCRGQIAGYATDTTTGDIHAFLATPREEKEHHDHDGHCEHGRN